MTLPQCQRQVTYSNTKSLPGWTRWISWLCTIVIVRVFTVISITTIPVMIAASIITLANASSIVIAAVVVEEQLVVSPELRNRLSTVTSLNVRVVLDLVHLGLVVSTVRVRIHLWQLSAATSAWDRQLASAAVSLSGHRRKRLAAFEVLVDAVD